MTDKLVARRGVMSLIRVKRWGVCVTSVGAGELSIAGVVRMGLVKW